MKKLLLLACLCVALTFGQTPDQNATQLISSVSKLFSTGIAATMPFMTTAGMTSPNKYGIIPLIDIYVRAPFSFGVGLIPKDDLNTATGALPEDMKTDGIGAALDGFERFPFPFVAVAADLRVRIKAPIPLLKKMDFGIHINQLPEGLISTVMEAALGTGMGLEGFNIAIDGVGIDARYKLVDWKIISLSGLLGFGKMEGNYDYEYNAPAQPLGGGATGSITGSVKNSFNIQALNAVAMGEFNLKILKLWGGVGVSYFLKKEIVSSVDTSVDIGGTIYASKPDIKVDDEIPAISPKLIVGFKLLIFDFTAEATPDAAALRGGISIAL